MLKCSCFLRASSLPEASLFFDVLLHWPPDHTVVTVMVTDQNAVLKNVPPTQIIKKSIAYRAKYRVHGADKNYSPLLVVSHPSNRGGVPVTSLRTKELVGTIVKEACDVVEANNSSAVVCVHATNQVFHY